MGCQCAQRLAPSTLVARKGSMGPIPSTLAAEWRTSSQPFIPAVCSSIAQRKQLDEEAKNSMQAYLCLGAPYAQTPTHSGSILANIYGSYIGPPCGCRFPAFALHLRSMCWKAVQQIVLHNLYRSLEANATTIDSERHGVFKKTSMFETGSWLMPELLQPAKLERWSGD